MLLLKNMFDFNNKLSDEYVTFLKFYNETTNKFHSVDYIKQNVRVHPYKYVPEYNLNLYNAIQQESIISDDDCELIIKEALAQGKWSTHAAEKSFTFWSGRTMPVFAVALASNNMKIMKAVLHLYDTMEVLISNRFNCSEPVMVDQIGFVHWPVGSWQVPHIDAIPELDRVCGTVLYLNDTYVGGETHYPYFGISVKPKRGMAIMHSPDNEHLHGVTKVHGCARYTISSTWSKLKYKNTTYNKDLQTLRTRVQNDTVAI